MAAVTHGMRVHTFEQTISGHGLSKLGTAASLLRETQISRHLLGVCDQAWFHNLLRLHPGITRVDNLAPGVGLIRIRWQSSRETIPKHQLGELQGAGRSGQFGSHGSSLT
jgi:hypothetical protein